MKQHALVIAIIVILLANTGLVMPASGIPLSQINNVSPFDSPYGTITVNATVADYSIAELPVYHGILREGESVNKIFQEPRACENVTTPEDAPEVARNVLEPYGGLPADAVSNGAFTQHERIYNYTLQQHVLGQPEATTISYHQKMINGLWTIGDSNYIRVELGENDEVLRIVKIWRNYTYVGNVSVISLNSAFEKLRQGDVVSAPMVSDEDITIDMASPGYYAKKIGTSDSVLEPIWILYGNTSFGSRRGFYIYARHFANFAASETNVSTYQTIQFTDMSETTPTKWYWDFGDGTNSHGQNPSHLYRTTGNYTISLTAWNDMGSDTETKTEYISVSSQTSINEDFNATPTIASIGDTIRFSDTHDVLPTQWLWDFGDSKSSALPNPTHVYNQSGNFTVNLTVWNVLGSDTVSKPDYIRIYPDPKPVAVFVSNFSWGSTIGPVTVAFEDSSAGNITNRFWDFGDGTNSTEQDPIHVFTIPPTEMYGDYLIRLNVSDNYGRSSVSDDYGYGITVVKGLLPEFTPEHLNRSNPLNVTFTDLTPDSEKAMGYMWDFGDGNYYDRWVQPLPRIIYHEYAAEGNYRVTLTYFGPREDSYSGIKDLTVHATTSLPAADFSANITSGKTPLAVAFADMSSGSPTTWSWDFGDRTNAEKQNPVHVYTAPGKYAVSLHVTNDDGDDTKTKTNYILVLMELPSVTIVPPQPAPPVSDFTATPVSGKSPLTVTFSDLSSASPDRWNWNFGDGTGSSVQKPVHTYISAGNYTISLKVTNEDGSDTSVRPDYITVTSPVRPVPEFPFLGRTTMLPWQLVTWSTG
jgi:PKD repeat protein